MLARIPMVAACAKANDISQAFLKRNKPWVVQEFTEALSKMTSLKHIMLTGSGIAAFFIILKSLKEVAQRDEVILPAYTAGSLVVAIKKAGLKPVLCDVSLKDFNADKGSLLKKISYRTLAINCVHSFGLGMHTVEELRRMIPPDIYLIEDCCQAMGTKIKGQGVGAFSEVSFFSFNRGKNFPIYAGGFIATNRHDIAKIIAGQGERLMRGPSREEREDLFFRTLAFSLATSRWPYSLLYPLAAKFKDLSVPLDFEVMHMSNFQASLGNRIAQKAADSFNRRIAHGRYLYEALKGLAHIELPELSAQQAEETVFNRFPALIKDAAHIPLIERSLLSKGIESSRGYEKPLYKMFEMGVFETDFPNAQYLAEHLLTVPVHHLLEEEDLKTIVASFKEF